MAIWKFNPEFTFEQTGAEWVVMDPAAGTVVRASGTAADVLTEIAHGVSPLPAFLDDLAAALAARGVIIDQSVPAEHHSPAQSGVSVDSAAPGMSRRRLLSTGALTAGAATLVATVGIHTLVLPTAASAASVLVAPTATATAGDGEVTVNWTNVDWATSYQIFYKATVDDYISFDPAVLLGPVTVTGLVNYLTYDFKVVATGGSTSLGSDPVSAMPTTASINLGTADSFAVLAATGITNAGATTITGDFGSHPTGTITGLDGRTPAAADVVALAKADLQIAFNDAASRSPASVMDVNLAGRTLTPGVYDSGTFAIDGAVPLTLDGQNQPNPVFIFRAASTLVAWVGSSVVLTNGAAACRVYWQVGSSATIETSVVFKGSIMAQTTITVASGATIDGRALAIAAAVTLDTNTITRPVCP